MSEESSMSTAGGKQREKNNNMFKRTVNVSEGIELPVPCMWTSRLFRQYKMLAYKISKHIQRCTADGGTPTYIPHCIQCHQSTWGSIHWGPYPYNESHC